MSNTAHKAKLTGIWSGVIDEDHTGDSYPIKMEVGPVDPQQHTFTGEFEINHKDFGIIRQDVSGQFESGTAYVQLKFENEDPGVMNFGTATFFLSHNGKKIDGRFITNAHMSEDLIVGKASFQKENDRTN